MENRVFESIDKEIAKGENTFYFYGDYIHDWYLYDLYRGVCEIADVLKYSFFEKGMIDYFFYCKNDVFSAYEYVNGEIRECSDKIFEGKKAATSITKSKKLSLNNVNNDAAGTKNDNAQKVAKKENENDAGEKAVENTADSKEKVNFKKAITFSEEHRDKMVLFFFEDYEWTAGMCRSSNDTELEYIEKAKKLSSLKNAYVIYSIEEIQMLKNYNFSIDGKNTIMLGSPSAEEVFSVFLRIYIRNYKEAGKELGDNFFKELSMISEAIASGDKSLKEAVRIFEKVMVEKNGRIDHADFSDSLDKIIEEKVYLDDVVLAPETKEEVVARVDKFLNAEDVSEVTKGFILTGPSGTGKTYLVKALANEKNCYFMSASLADLKAEYVGQSAPKIKRIFQKARANAPTILFIDEADTVFPSRDQGGNDSDSFAKDMVNQFLVEMDGMLAGKSKVFVVAATNRVGVLDNAIKSRLGKPIEIPLPNKNERKQLFTKLLEKKGMPFATFGFVDEFLDKTNHMSGRDIKDFVNNLEKESQKNIKVLSEYKDESETKELFYKCLKLFEEDLVRNLEDSLGIIISRPDDKIKYKNIIGCDDIKRVIDQQVAIFDPLQRVKAEEYGIKIKRGILLYGPPGNGKSQIAKAAANEHKLYFMKITSDTFTKISLSDQNKTLIKIFNSALQLSEMCGENIKGVLLFFDEFDSLASKELLDSRVRGTMLTQLDDTDTFRNAKTKVLFMAATNFYEKLDEAMIRAGRIDDKVEMKDPSEDDGIKMLKQFCADNPKVEAVDDSVAKEAYDKYIQKRKKIKRTKYIISQKIVWLMAGRDLEELKEYADEYFDLYRPSGADLKNYSERLIAASFYKNNFSSKNKLKITEEIIDEVLSEEVV